MPAPRRTRVCSGSLDALTDLVAEIQGNNGQPTHILLAPDAWGELRKLKIGTDYNSTLLGAGVADAELRLLGIPVIVNPAVPSLSGRWHARSSPTPCLLSRLRSRCGSPVCAGGRIRCIHGSGALYSHVTRSADQTFSRSSSTWI